ncbi:2bb8c208-3e11-4c38-8712-8d50f056a6b5 [Sclerotinia trifoliorum]|uniref:2bb8c208-3e11-4c38-8712-8d50f056a6b5 n=1 Tax=Sclerotinia trifoliorum TaxID=28548 RepID=A0A8H2VRQ9_9HELO|nr:2bb8c208-3e11-4c38-8712-8d50f056a6b5 [Sclerotinia trifoliorum]
MATQLVSLPDVERLSPTVIRILGGNPGKFTLQGTNTYLVGKGKNRLLIDTGEGRESWIRNLKDTLEKEQATISSCILTHWHHDHVKGVDHLLEYSPKTIIHKNRPGEGQTDIKDGQIFSTDGATLRAVHSPGHTQDHMALIFEEEDAMFTGDNVLGHGTAVFEDLTTYLNSLERMKGIFSGKAYPGHGAVIEDGPAKIGEYIRHRKERESQVIQVLKSAKNRPGVTITRDEEADEWTSMEIVKIVYRDVPESLHVPANGGILQILNKLQADEKVVQEQDRWKLKARAAL